MFSQLRRLERLERAVMKLQMYSPDCNCFPENEQPTFAWRVEFEIAMAVKCPLHGDRFKPRLRIYMAKWCRENALRYLGRAIQSSTGKLGSLPSRQVNGPRRKKSMQIKHGIFSSVVIADSEDQKLYDDLVTELCNEYVPVGKREQMALEKAVVYLWRERRALKYEAQQCDSREQAGLRQQLGSTIQYEAHLRKGYKDAIQELERLQAERKGKEEMDSSTRATGADVTT